MFTAQMDWTQSFEVNRRINPHPIQRTTKMSFLVEHKTRLPCIFNTIIADEPATKKPGISKPRSTVLAWYHLVLAPDGMSKQLSQNYM